MRKVIIGLITLVAVAAAFFVYLTLSGDSRIQPAEPVRTDSLDVPENLDSPERTGDTVVHNAGRSVYHVLDPETNKLTRAMGFSKLLSSGTEASRWNVVQPYIIIYEKQFQCRIDADTGQFQIETAAGVASPRDAELAGNVVITITPNKGSDFDATKIYMDRLSFSSERSEFSSDGPVKAESSQLHLLGRGLLAIYDARNARLEYLNIRDLQELRLKDFATRRLSSMDKQPSAAAVSNPSAVSQAASQEVTAAVAVNNSASSSDAADEKPATPKKQEFYRCDFRENVMLRYGDELLAEKADSINLINLLLKSSKSKTTQPKPAAATQEPVVAPVVAVAEQPATVATTQPEESAVSVNKDIVLTCDGGMILKLMADGEKLPTVDKQPPLGMVAEMTGSPLTIQKIIPGAREEHKQIARCGVLRYFLTEEVLALYPNALQDEIVLNAFDESGAFVVAKKLAKLNRSEKQFTLVGPGRIVLPERKTATVSAVDSAAVSKLTNGQISYNDRVTIAYAETDSSASSNSFAVQTIDIEGGFDSQIQQGDSGKLFKAGAQQAMLKFASDNIISKVILKDKARFENVEAQDVSSAAADMVTLDFDAVGDLLSADLLSGVDFVSGRGLLETAHAVVDFVKDPVKGSVPGVIKTFGYSTLKTLVKDANQKPAIFKAQDMNYDLQAGSGHATGPIEFTFYMPGRKTAGNKTAVSVPVVITAQDKVTFAGKPNEAITDIVFLKDVVGLREFQDDKFLNTQKFFGDRMAVKLTAPKLSEAGGKTQDIELLTLQGKNVGLEAKRFNQGVKVSHINLTADEMRYDGLQRKVTAKGPGEMKLSNQHAESVSDSQPKKGLDLTRPCYAVLDSFDTLDWWVDTMRLSADSGDGLFISYAPLKNGVPEDIIKLQGGHMDMTFVQDSLGKNNLSKLTAENGVVMETSQHFLKGHELTYDKASSTDGDWITIKGSETQSCWLDGMSVPMIYYNLVTGQARTRLSTTPGTLLMGD